MREKKKKPILKRWWFWVIVVIISMSILGSKGEKGNQEGNEPEKIASTSGADNEAENEQKESEEPKITKIKAGNYKVGEDLPAGEYKLFTDGIMAYYEIGKDSSGDLGSVITNDNFTTFTYLTVSDGQYLKLQMCYAVPAEEVEPYESDGGYGSGVYKVGYDIPAGEYNVQKEEGQMFGYVEVAKDSRGALDSIITNDNFETNKYVTVKDGQYLKIIFGYIE